MTLRALARLRSFARAGLLQDHLTSEPDALGDIAHKGDLPFLFKVISINKALSIQVSRPKHTRLRKLAWIV